MFPHCTQVHFPSTNTLNTENNKVWPECIQADPYVHTSLRIRHSVEPYLIIHHVTMCDCGMRQCHHHQRFKTDRQPTKISKSQSSTVIRSESSWCVEPKTGKGLLKLMSRCVSFSILKLILWQKMGVYPYGSSTGTRRALD